MTCSCPVKYFAIMTACIIFMSVVDFFQMPSFFHILSKVCGQSEQNLVPEWASTMCCRKLCLLSITMQVFYKLWFLSSCILLSWPKRDCPGEIVRSRSRSRSRSRNRSRGRVRVEVGVGAEVGVCVGKKSGLETKIQVEAYMEKWEPIARLHWEMSPPIL